MWAFWEHGPFGSGPFGNNGGPFGNKGGPFGNNRWAFWEQQVGLLGTGPFGNMGLLGTIKLLQ